MSEVRRRSLLIIGAGPHGLTLAVRAVNAGLRPGQDLEVLDPTGDWCAEWRHRFAAHGIESLRSPGVHHPGLDPGGLSSFAESMGLRSKAAYGQPLSAAFNSYCSHLVSEAGLTDAVTAKRARLLAADTDSVTVLSDGDDVVHADHAVLATNPGRRRIPGWVSDLLPLPLPALAHSGDVDLRRLDLQGETITIVGGGLTAAQLALGARDRGAERVHLVIRRWLRGSTFDVAPGWLGPKYLDDFALLDPGERASAIRTARDGGSLPESVLIALRASEANGEIDIHEGARVVAGTAMDDRPTIVLGDETHLRSNRLWLATGSECSVDACRLLDDVVACHPCEQHDGLPDLGPDLAWPGTALHLSGRLAGLALGPAAGNLWGAKQAADRILPILMDSLRRGSGARR